MDLLERCKFGVGLRGRGVLTPGFSIHLDPAAGVVDGVGDTPAVVILGGMRQLEIGDVRIRLIHVRHPVVRSYGTTIDQRIVEFGGGHVVSPAGPEYLVPHITRLLDPVRFPNPRWALACVVGFVEDIAGDLITEWVGLRGFGEVSQGGWVGVVHDLVGRADPLGVPLDDVGG